MSRGVRFRPPALPVSAELQWLLIRAYGPPEALAGVPEGRAVLELAVALGLDVRVAARTDPSRLANEIGEAAAVGFISAGARAATSERRQRRLIDTLGSVAAKCRVPVAFLKGPALRLTGLVKEGQRTANDIDVLVPTEQTASLAAALAERGFEGETRPAPPAAHQLPLLISPEGVVVEIHVSVPAVRLATSPEFVDFETARAEGALVPARGLPPECFVPTREFLAAHAIAHGIAQHGFVPASYPLARMLADVIDLGFAGAEPEPAVQRWISQDVTEDEHRGVVRLCGRLAAGDPTALDDSDVERAECVLLRHIIAGTLDSEYQRSLKVAALFGQPSDRPPPIARLRAIGELLWLNEVQLERLHGPHSRLGYLGLRVARPFRLAARWARNALPRLG